MNPTIDPQLVAIDAGMGYHWAGFVAWFADYPLVGKALAYIYASSLWQLGIVFLCLAWLNRAGRLYTFVLTGTLSLLITLAIWVTWPSFGPSVSQVIPPEIAKAISLYTDNTYGKILMLYATEGMALIHPDAIIGHVAFPSFHMVMACMSVWFLRQTIFFWPMAAVNLAMIPATLVHGGHHLIDLIAGAIIFAFATKLAGLIINALHEDHA